MDLEEWKAIGSLGSGKATDMELCAMDSKLGGNQLFFGAFDLWIGMKGRQLYFHLVVSLDLGEGNRCGTLRYRI